LVPLLDIQRLKFSMLVFRHGEFLQPYEGDTDNHGLQVIDMDNLLNATLESDKHGLQVYVLFYLNLSFL
jgi:hypothetical protein